jgi:hypothetical protein
MRTQLAVIVILVIGLTLATIRLVGTAHAAQRTWHRVACAKTEDARLMDCHGHRLDYRHGGWYAP